MNVVSHLGRLASPFREFGAFAGLLYILDRLLRRLDKGTGLHVYELMAQPVAGIPVLRPSLLRSIEYRLIAADDPLIAEMPARAEIKEARFAQGAICIGTFRGGRLIAYLWYCSRVYREDEVRCDYVLPTEGGSVFDFDVYVLPEHRMGVAFAALWHGAAAHLRSVGINCSFSRITRFNLASRRSHAHFGARRVGSAFFLVIRRLEIMVATVRPFLGMSYGDGRVRIRLPVPK